MTIVVMIVEIGTARGWCEEGGRWGQEPCVSHLDASSSSSTKEAHNNHLILNGNDNNNNDAFDDDDEVQLRRRI